MKKKIGSGKSLVVYTDRNDRNKGEMLYTVLLSICFFFLRTNGRNTDWIQSACSNGGVSDKYAYACPHMMMLSDSMINASKSDGLSEWFEYAVAGSGNDDQECGMCFQVQLLDAEREWRPDFKDVIVQVVNSGFDVTSHQFDIFMGGGGFGYFTACNEDCRDHYCQGGPCREGMYEGTTFKNWVNAQYDDPNLCYSGGIKWLDQMKNQSHMLQQLCLGLTAMRYTNGTKSTVDSCYRTNMQLYHQNFVSSRLSRVQCPPSLVEMTGLRRTDDSNYPQADRTLVLTETCNGDRTNGRYCITTMQDCCKMSCSWNGKVASDISYPSVYTCDRHGTIIF